MTRRGGLVLLCVLVGSLAFASVCEAELRDSLAGWDEAGVATGLDAARVLERAVTLVEPALPRLAVVGDLPIDPGHAALDTVRYLAERRLLPPDWDPDTISAEAWSAMLSRFLAWYGLAPFEAEPPRTDGDLVVDGARALASVSAAIRPAAVLATEPTRDAGLAFRGVIMNWTVYPRLVVFRPGADTERSVDTAKAIASLETCARRIHHYFSAPEATAIQLFLANNRARMIVVGSAPSSSRSWPYWVESGDEVGVFTFDDPRIADVDAYSVVFDGPAIGLAALVRLLPGIRTNVSPLGLRQYLQTPH